MTKAYNGNNWNIVEIETTRELENFLSAPILNLSLIHISEPTRR
jgi:hypothetical protein